MVTQTGAPRSYSSHGQRLAAGDAGSGPDYQAAWKALAAMATPEMKALMAKCLARANTGR